MKEFHSFLAMGEHLSRRAMKIGLELEAGLEKVGQIIEKKAKSEFGHYHRSVGPFPRWKRLSATTLDGWGPFPGKVALGYAPPDNPLLREGTLRDGISHEVGLLEVAIGSPDDKMVYHEFGTSRMPPRPVLGPAAYRSKSAIMKLVGAALVTGIVGPTEAAMLGLSYNFRMEVEAPSEG